MPLLDIKKTLEDLQAPTDCFQALEHSALDTMSLTIAPVELADFDQMEKYVANDQEDHLNAPILLETWPVKTAEEAKRRWEWSLHQQCEHFEKDKTAQCMKVVDPQINEIISLARWHRYSNGFPQENTYLEIDGFAPPGTDAKPPSDLNFDLHKALLEGVLEARAE